MCVFLSLFPQYTLTPNTEWIFLQGKESTVTSAIPSSLLCNRHFLLLPPHFNIIISRVIWIDMPKRLPCHFFYRHILKFEIGVVFARNQKEPEVYKCSQSKNLPTYICQFLAEHWKPHFPKPFLYLVYS